IRRSRPARSCITRRRSRSCTSACTSAAPRCASMDATPCAGAKRGRRRSPWAGFSGLSVHDTTTSWFDSLSFDSYRFVQNVHDPHYHANRDTQIFPDEHTYRTKDGKVGPSVADPLDDVSLVYLVRTLPLAPGQCYVFRRYFKPDGNPV